MGHNQPNSATLIRGLIPTQLWHVLEVNRQTWYEFGLLLFLAHYFDLSWYTYRALTAQITTRENTLVVIDKEFHEGRHVVARVDCFGDYLCDWWAAQIGRWKLPSAHLAVNEKGPWGQRHLVERSSVHRCHVFFVPNLPFMSHLIGQIQPHHPGNLAIGRVITAAARVSHHRPMACRGLYAANNKHR